MQFQTGGGCRASNYIWLLRKALKNMGMEYVPVISLSFSGMEKQSGFKITPVMLLKGIMAVLYGDMLMLLKNQITPYEINSGDTAEMTKKWNNTHWQCSNAAQKWQQNKVLSLSIQNTNLASTMAK